MRNKRQRSLFRPRLRTSANIFFKECQLFISFVKEPFIIKLKESFKKPSTAQDLCSRSYICVLYHFATTAVTHHPGPRPPCKSQRIAFSSDVFVALLALVSKAFQILIMKRQKILFMEKKNLKGGFLKQVNLFLRQRFFNWIK